MSVSILEKESSSTQQGEQASEAIKIKTIDKDLLNSVYKMYLDSPNSVDPTWRAYFSPGKSSVEIKHQAPVPGYAHANYASGQTKEQSEEEQNLVWNLKSLNLLRAYREKGYLRADLDPLNLNINNINNINKHDDQAGKVGIPELEASFHGMQEDDSAVELMNSLKQVYCGKIGYQFMHINNLTEQKWLQEKIESKTESSQAEASLSPTIKKIILETLVKAEGLEEFIHVKFKGAKRFSLEGGETAVVAAEAVIEIAANNGINEIVIGMAHRGRLNFLTNILKKKYRALFAGFQGKASYPDSIKISGDVKYHLGAACQRKTIFGNNSNGNNNINNINNDIYLSLTPNPSHLEAVNPVILGQVRAKQDAGQTKAMALLIHGDASFSGQGVVYESMLMEGLKDYKIEGTVHIIINNQVGFTADPKEGRGLIFPSFIGASLDIPIFHVNGDDPEAVMQVSALATEFRNIFKKDVIIDLICYRRYGHNEGDEPRFTQPLMYKIIDEHPTITEIYSKKLIQGNVISAEGASKLHDDFKQLLEEELKAAESYVPKQEGLFEEKWQDFSILNNPDIFIAAKSVNGKLETGVALPVLKELSQELCALPADFMPNDKIVRLLAQREAAVQAEEHIDWGNAEALAFGSLLQDGSFIRLAGQDSRRGTFSHRHAVLVDQEKGNCYTPLNNIRGAKGASKREPAKITVVNSLLSEYAALGYEYGYSLVDPNNLVLWEGQFGDFVNGAQIIIDQFISAAEQKWLKSSSLVMLLPHAYEGQGPEHSSARLERFLQLAADFNMYIANCSTPANYFHILRRQMAGHIRKPLVLLTPKSLLRHKLAVSKLEDFQIGTYFKEIIVDDRTDRIDSAASGVKQDNKTHKIRKIILCSGKVYYDLLQYKNATVPGIREKDDILLIRIEQLYPFPAQELLVELNKYSQVDSQIDSKDKLGNQETFQLIWCQEEPKNMGAWFFIKPIIEDLCQRKITYVGRKEAASPATGYAKAHEEEQQALIKEALS